MQKYKDSFTGLLQGLIDIDELASSSNWSIKNLICPLYPDSIASNRGEVIIQLSLKPCLSLSSTQ